MSMDTQHAEAESHGHTAAHGPEATPGKHTQVAMLGAHPGSAPEPKEAQAASASSAGVNLATLQQFIGKHEGNVDHVYLDSRGFPTAGIGHLLVGSHLRVGQKVSAEQVTSWFQQDVAKAITGAKQQLGAAYERLDEARKIVVIDMVFNLGSAGFGAFHNTIHAMQTGAYAQAADGMLHSLWASQVGNRAKEDAEIMRTGHLAGGGGTGGAGTGGGQPAHGHGGGGGATGSAVTIGDVRAGHAVLKVGSSGPAVTHLQQLVHVAADGIFGPQTAHAVEQFQHAHHLAVDGIVGTHTLEALEHKAPPKHATGQPTAHVAPPGKHPDGKHPDGNAPDGKWTPAPELAAVQSGTATLHEGEKGGSVKHVQKLLAVDTDGEFGPATRAAVRELEREHHLERNDGVIDAHTLAVLTKHPLGSIDGESHDGSAQRQKMLGIARSGSLGRRPDGRCYAHVCEFLIQCGGYGKITNPFHQFPSSALPLAHDFADLMNAGGATRFGLEKLSISNPYDAPAGSIVVVKAGSPGTHHPTAGDIAIADGHGNFFNGGMMGYSGRAGWNASPSAHLLGCYIPR